MWCPFNLSPGPDLSSLLEILPQPQTQRSSCMSSLKLYMFHVVVTSLPNQTKYLRDGIFVLFTVLTQSLAQKLMCARTCTCTHRTHQLIWIELFLLSICRYLRPYSNVTASVKTSSIPPGIHRLFSGLDCSPCYPVLLLPFWYSSTSRVPQG